MESNITLEKFMATVKGFLYTLCLTLLMMTSAYANERVNINTADVATLDRVLIGIGPSKAEAIVQHRKENGPFKSMDQLIDVKGIGLATLEKNRDRIVIANVQVARAPAKAAAVATAPKQGSGR